MTGYNGGNVMQQWANQPLAGRINQLFCVKKMAISMKMT
jgi:hypothetical protein